MWFNVVVNGQSNTCRQLGRIAQIEVAGYKRNCAGAQKRARERWNESELKDRFPIYRDQYITFEIIGKNDEFVAEQYGPDGEKFSAQLED